MEANSLFRSSDRSRKDCETVLGVMYGLYLLDDGKTHNDAQNVILSDKPVGDN
jgi:hypothetical protein